MKVDVDVERNQGVVLVSVLYRRRPQRQHFDEREHLKLPRPRIP